jgi:hypothetical protein
MASTGYALIAKGPHEGTYLGVELDQSGNPPGEIALVNQPNDTIIETAVPPGTPNSTTYELMPVADKPPEAEELQKTVVYRPKRRRLINRLKGLITQSKNLIQ